MDTTEAQQILDRHVTLYEQRAYDELLPLVLAKHTETFEQTGTSGATYQIEMQFFWDASPGGAIRIIGSIDDGGIRAFIPLCSDTLVYPTTHDVAKHL